MGNALLRLLTKYELEIAEDFSHIIDSSDKRSKMIHKSIPVDPNNVIVTPDLKVYIRQRKWDVIKQKPCTNRMISLYNNQIISWYYSRCLLLALIPRKIESKLRKI